ncbi:CarD family transcriptional regulator [Virgibacillus profundi]|uniref:CarD family transcriptional regulator n=1 Tax=Virgibacillus profundi TaxID=2024555 RepID=A0A2A2I9V9_9BACI|nr:CarD family transcriptional regulator [Virgibacillus profundi]PAV28064.1 CarD family transcriptional regulator [Virgibacillus profundi]PXY52368.1 CarD family transcriptional regulator [Virgibacillus profundi]
MFSVGDLIIYSTHGLCEIVEISDKTLNNVTRTYYVMHPIDDPKLKISSPVDNEKATMHPIMEKEEANGVLESFQEPGIQWIDDSRQRNKKFQGIVNTGDRHDISNLINTLMRKEQEIRKDNKKMSIQDRKVLEQTQSIMFTELAVSLDTSFEKITKKIKGMIKQTA